MHDPLPIGEYLESREEFQERVIASVMHHAETNLYRGPEILPYHNTEHMRFVHDRVVSYCDYAEENGKRPDRFALRLAAILHDAGYHEDHARTSEGLMARGWIKSPLQNKEAYSEWLAGPLLESYGLEEKTVTKVQRLIKKTNVSTTPKTLDEKILVRADLDNISGPTQHFVMTTLKLVREAEIMNGPKNPFERIAISFRTLNEYASKDLCFGDFDRDIYDRTFRRPAHANIARIAENNIRSTIGELGKRALAIVPGIHD